MQSLEAHGESIDKRLWHLSALNNKDKDKYKAILICDQAPEGRGIEFSRGFMEHVQQGLDPRTLHGDMPKPVCVGQVIFKGTRLLAGESVVDAIEGIAARVRDVVDSAGRL